MLISGAGKGIGRHLACSMAKHSAFVYCIDKKFPKDVPKDIKKNMYHVKCDITKKKSIQTVCKNIFLKHKKIDELVNNSGITIKLMKGKLFYEKENSEYIKIENQRVTSTDFAVCVTSEKTLKHLS